MKGDVIGKKKKKIAFIISGNWLIFLHMTFLLCFIKH